MLNFSECLIKRKSKNSNKQKLDKQGAIQGTIRDVYSQWLIATRIILKPRFYSTGLYFGSCPTVVIVLNMSLRDDFVDLRAVIFIHQPQIGQFAELIGPVGHSFRIRLMPADHGIFAGGIAKDLRHHDITDVVAV